MQAVCRDIRFDLSPTEDVGDRLKRQMDALGALAHLVAARSSMSPDSWRRFAAIVAEAVSAEHCGIWHLAQDGQLVSRLAVWPENPAAGGEPAIWAQTRRSIRSQDPVVREMRGETSSRNPAVIDTPVLLAGERVGVIRMSGLPQAHALDDESRRFLDAAADIAAQCMGPVATPPAEPTTAPDGAGENLGDDENQHLNDLLGAISEFIWEADRDGVLTFVTDGVRRMLGFEPKQLIGRSLFDLMPGDDAAAMRSWYAMAVDNVVGFSKVEHRCRTKDGPLVWLRQRGVPLRDAQGESIGFRGAALDITESHRSRLALLQRERRLQEAERIARLGYWEILTPSVSGSWSSISSYWSDVLNDIWGRTPGDPPPTLDMFLESVHPDDRMAVLSAIRSPQSQKHLEFRIRRADGSERELISDFRADVDDKGVVVRSYGTAQDVTEHRQAERERIASEQRYRLLADNANDLITLLTADMTVLYASPSTRRLLGYGADELVGMNLYRLVNPLDLTTMRKAHARLQDGAAESSVTCRMRHKDGRWVWVESTSNRVTGTAEGQAASYVAVSRDISERVRYQQDLEEERRHIEAQAVTLSEAAEKLQAARLEAEQARRAAEDANRAKSQFLATMSHELRTPLNAIIGFAEVIKDMHFGKDAYDRYIDYAADIHDSGHHLLDLINDILDIAKIEAGKLRISPEILELQPTLQGCLRLFSTRATAKDLTLQCTTTPAEATLYADERAIKQILFNLLSNAVKFTMRGGHITVRATIDDDETVEIAVADTGIGIPEDHIERVMRPFEQYENSYDRMQEGTGLGLSLVKALTEIHGGTVQINSRVGVGTTVAVRFPADREWQPCNRSVSMSL